jgi:hypothetical protein
MLAFFTCAASMVVDIIIYLVDPSARQRRRLFVGGGARA